MAQSRDGRFAGKVAIVTGSTANPSIGRACAARLLAEGASVVINGRNEERLEAAVAELRDLGSTISGVAGAVDGPGEGGNSAVAKLVDRAISEFGGLDLVVSTVGGAPFPLPFDTIDETQLTDTLRLNTWPTLALVQEALRRGLGQRPSGAVVCISSGSPHKTTSAMVSYAAAKAALNAMVRTMAADLASRGVRLNAVSPGLVRTTATRPIWKEDGGQGAGAALPLGRLTEAEDVAAAVCFLLSDDARQITGIALDVDAGNHLGRGWTPIR